LLLQWNVLQLQEVLAGWCGICRFCGLTC
jgi:hypothetical protein